MFVWHGCPCQMHVFHILLRLCHRQFSFFSGSSNESVSAWHASSPRVRSPRPAHSFVRRLGHEKISTAILSLPLIQEEHLSVTVMVLSFRTDRSGQTVQTQIRLLPEEQSDLGLHCLRFWLHLLGAASKKPSCSNFRVITANFLGVRIFRILRYWQKDCTKY